MKVPGIVLDQGLTFAKHVMAVARSCNHHAQAIHHIRYLLSTDLASTLACSLILSRLDYCNSLLHGAPTDSISTLRVCWTMQPGSSCRLRDDHMHDRHCVNCTGCQFLTELTTSWLWWLTRSIAQHRHISVDTSSCASLHIPYAYRMFHCLTNLLSEQNLLSILSDILHCLPGTRYLHKLSIVTLLLVSNLG